MAIGPEAEAWFRRNADSIRARKLEYLPKWQGKSADDIAVRTLRVEDGI
ncbi:hypothetical protein I0E98_06355 [Pseudomonas lalucatii]|nr:hypothetical protein [Pseudomonas lalucatii]